MARNEEKAQSMLYRFREAMLIESGVKRHPKDLKSLHPSTCTSIPIAEQNRRDTLKEIHRKIGRIQDKELELAVVRTLNDEINEGIERIRVWDERIRELGGLSRRSQRRIEEFEAATVGTSGISANDELLQFEGKYYFGRARELPEVQDFLQHRQVIDKESAELSRLRKQRAEMYAQVDHVYYGLIDEQRAAAIKLEEEDIFGGEEEDVNVNDNVDMLTLREGLNVPTQEQVQEYLLERRKGELLKKYTE